MELGELQQLLKKKQCKPFLIFTGAETVIMNLYIDQIQKLLNVPLKRSDSVESVYSRLNCRTVFHDKAFYVIKDDTKLIQNEKVWSSLPLYLGNNYLILIYSSLDKRSKFYKQNEQNIIEFEKLRPDQLVKYVHSKLKVSEKQAQELADICECDYGRLMLEVEKLCTLSQALGQNFTDEATYNLALNSNLIHISPRDVAFDFVDAVMRNNANLSMDLLAELREFKTAEVMILSLLYNNFRNILLVQASGRDVSTEKTGLTGWQIQLAKEKLGYYSVDELVENLEAVRSVEKGIKTGQIESDIALEYCLAKVLKR